MFDILIGLSKSSIKSVFSVVKYEEEILEEDLHRIVFIRNLIEENENFVNENFPDIDATLFNSVLKQYALELFTNQCVEAIPIKERNSKNFNIEKHKAEDKKYFNYIYSKLKSPD